MPEVPRARPVPRRPARVAHRHSEVAKLALSEHAVAVMKRKYEGYRFAEISQLSMNICFAITPLNIFILKTILLLNEFAFIPIKITLKAHKALCHNKDT